MSTLEPYGVVQNNNNSEPQSSQPSAGLMATMRLAFSADGTAMYKPVMPQTPPHSTSATPPPPFQAGGDASAVAVAPLCINATGGEQTKRKRGRPRKYGLDGTMAPFLTSPPPRQTEVAFQSSGALPAVTSPPSGKKPRGRPPGSGRKQNVAAMGSTGFGFTPRVITVNTGEDVSSKIMSFSQNGSGAICILSANGAISNVTLRQAATSGGTVTYEGRFEILTLSGSYMLLESGGQRSRTGGLSVLLAGPDGRVLGGGVAGLLTAAAPVQVVPGGFNASAH
ncbi:AT-hook motif nuclear-localized protein 10-like isoform X2 [Diospyros lotus]|uniref:AT-hook motif nuclear-localized protein 10-like isoform X2 n=1 Tax=Diospyros lotus TaxID=55363 RepID=UPI00225806E4|nr:AT-hook motif nuclear-localized protein 10-like isoform X2 [Diospyros lotus]